MKNDLYFIRDYEELTDKNFILATWLRNLYYGSSFYSKIPQDVFMGAYHAVLQRFMSEDPIIKVACLQEDPEVILGYCVYRKAGDGAVLDYIFVKKAWRKIGIGKALLPENVKAVTHLTKQAEAMLTDKLPGVHFNPFLI